MKKSLKLRRTLSKFAFCLSQISLLRRSWDKDPIFRPICPHGGKARARISRALMGAFEIDATSAFPIRPRDLLRREVTGERNFSRAIKFLWVLVTKGSFASHLACRVPFNYCNHTFGAKTKEMKKSETAGDESLLFTKVMPWSWLCTLAWWKWQEERETRFGSPELFFSATLSY